MGLSKLGRYDIVRVLGRGAMGTVYEARDPNLERRVAIKTIAVQGLSEEGVADYEARFRTEARSAARLQHPNIVSVYDSGRDGETAYLVMEFVEGEDLKHHLGRGATFTLDQSVRIMRDLLAALGYAHAQNVVHRDVKPANLLIEASGRVKLTDFGVARIQDAGDATRTRGTMVGTLKYMSPEQVQGEPVDARSDLFSAGVVLYELLTARQPFRGDNEFAIIAQIIGADPPAPSTLQPALPAAIDAVLACALAKSPEQRYGSARAFHAALVQACDEVEDLSTAPMPLEPAAAAGYRQSRPGSSGGGSSGTARSLPAVTQELELVYWKDVRDSDDVADLQGFLERFPDGIYADLARRRLRKLGVAVVGEQTATLVEPRMPEQAPAPPAGEAPPPNAATAVAAATQPDLRRRRAVAMRTAAIAVAVFAIIAAVWVAGGPDARPPEQSLALPASSPAAAHAPPAPASDVRTDPVLPAAAVAASRPAAVPAVAPQGLAAAPPSVGSSAVKGRTQATTPVPTRDAPSAGRTDAASPASQPLASDAVVALPARPASARELPAAGDANPEQACAGRLLLAYQICLNEQCAKPALYGHPVCEQRRAAEQALKQQQNNRN